MWLVRLRSWSDLQEERCIRIRVGQREGRTSNEEMGSSIGRAEKISSLALVDGRIVADGVQDRKNTGSRIDMIVAMQRIQFNTYVLIGVGDQEPSDVGCGRSRSSARQLDIGPIEHDHVFAGDHGRCFT